LTTLPGPPPGDAPRGRQRLGRQGPAVAPGRRRRPPGASLGPRLALASDPRSCDSRPRRASDPDPGSCGAGASSRDQCHWQSATASTRRWQHAPLARAILSPPLSERPGHRPVRRRALAPHAASSCAGASCGGRWQCWAGEPSVTLSGTLTRMLPLRPRLPALWRRAHTRRARRTIPGPATACSLTAAAGWVAPAGVTVPVGGCQWWPEPRARAAVGMYVLGA
jgi:hypothetical protein